MCARYSLTKEGLVITIGQYEVTIHIGARFNIAPNQKAPVIIPKHNRYESVDMTWGWKPAWSNQLLINAQSETIQEKPTFKKYLANRCLIVADGFYEWTADKTPIRFTRPDNEAFCIAGLYYTLTTQPLDVPVTEYKFILLTTKPNKSVAKFHDRMPMIVQPDHYGWWLDGNDMFKTVINFPYDREFYYCPVQRALNKAGTEGSELIRPAIIQKELL